MKVTSIAVILVNKKRILLNLRDNKPTIIFPNMWGFLGGGIEVGESEERAVKREVFEEIGYHLNDITKLEDIFLKEECRYSALYIGKIDIEIEKITLNEGQEIRYFEIGELERLNMPPLLKELVKKYRHEISNIN